MGQGQVTDADAPNTVVGQDPPTTCGTCGGKGTVNRKVWEDPPKYPGVHPSVLAGVPAQRTIKQFKCPDCTVSRDAE